MIKTKMFRLFGLIRDMVRTVLSLAKISSDSKLSRLKGAAGGGRSVDVRGGKSTGNEVLERRERGLGKLELDAAPLAVETLGMEQLSQVLPTDFGAGRLGERADQFIEVVAVVFDRNIEPL